MQDSNKDKSCHPIIYVRGYAMSQSEIDETTSDPFNGFNIGSVTYRATPDPKKPPNKFIFESPVVRLAKEYGYSTAFADGLDIVDTNFNNDIQRKTIVVHRYYEEASSLFGDAAKKPIEHFATRLSELVARLRDLVAKGPDAVDPEKFKCYLVAHSMGGLICRAFLQNPALDTKKVAGCVDKFFTYATPHNGIDLGKFNVPGILGAFDINNFNRERMAEYLALPESLKKSERADWVPQNDLFPRKVFCMIGTNRADYKAAYGLSRTFVGDGSDGLVKIANASVWGYAPKTGEKTGPAAKGYCYRSHSGWYGIVNSEESYQNLVRFLFGNVRVDVRVEITDVRLPAALASEKKPIDALYQFETTIGLRGKPWFLTRRTAEEDSAACRTHEELKNSAPATGKTIDLCTVFMANRYVMAGMNNFAYRMGLGIRVPDYTVDGVLWFDKHYEGGYLFRDAVISEITPPAKPGDSWGVKFSWETQNAMAATRTAPLNNLSNGDAEIVLEFDSKSDDNSPSTPGIAGRVIFRVSQWNAS
ncbi:MAG: hypothetical protein QM754_02710 [Tepidisphaeraceae bacterium]